MNLKNVFSDICFYESNLDRFISTPEIPHQKESRMTLFNY
jgi:hypothetical protein